MIRFPPPLPSNCTIGVTAPSSGLGVCSARYEHCRGNLSNQGYRFIEGDCLKKDHHAVSASAAERADELRSFWDNPIIDLIYPPWGGERLVEILEHLDLARFSATPPKWLMGYSDISLLLFVLTTSCRVATAHGTNLMEYGGEAHEPLTLQALEILRSSPGTHFQQNSAPYFACSFTPYQDDPTVSLKTTERVEWKALLDSPPTISGRMIGGCMEVLGSIVGTRFDSFPEFSQTYSSDGVILYLENCALNVHAQCRFLYNLKYAGWFDSVSGVALGRNAGPSDDSYPYIEMLNEFFGTLEIPVLYDIDIGHRQPNLTIVNGSIGEIRCNPDGSGSLLQRL